MKQYLVIIYITIKQLLTYRLSFLLWRFRTVLNLLFVYFLWTNIITLKTTFGQYNHQLIVSYILLVNVLSSLVLSTRTTDVVNDILSGDISNFLLKPISYFKYLISKEIGDKSLNFVFSILEIVFLLMIFKAPVFIQSNIINLLIFGFTLVLGIFLSFCISLCLSFIAFWSNDTWAPRFIYFILISLIAGTVFPLDILPQNIFNIILVSPFPYLLFLPAAIFIHGFSSKYLVMIIGAIIWSVIFFLIIKKVWKLGIKNYSAFGT